MFTHPDMTGSQFTESSNEHEPLRWRLLDAASSHGDIKTRSKDRSSTETSRILFPRSQTGEKRKWSQSREYSTYATRGFLLHSVSTDWISISRVSSWRGGWTAASIMVRRRGKQQTRKEKKRNWKERIREGKERERETNKKNPEKKQKRGPHRPFSWFSDQMYKVEIS